MGNLRVEPASAGSQLISAEALAGDCVVNTADEELGTLEHILVDVPSGRIAFAVVGRGGVFGIGERLFAVPWGALTRDAGRQCFILDISRERLEAAPGFDREHWPEMGDPRWANGIQEFYAPHAYEVNPLR
jgi:hypothetical protein